MTFTLDEFQKKAISAISNHKNVLITAPTGSGKTLPAEHAITKFCKEGKKVIYTSPIKALSNQKFHDFSEKFPDISFGLITGDNSTNVDADCLIMTTEILHNTLHQMKIKTDNPFTLHFEMDIHNELACVIYDEVHYINDPQRGGAWEGSMSMLPRHVVQVMLSATISRPEKIPNWFRETLNQEVVLCPHTRRSVPLRHHCFTSVPDSTVKKIRDPKIKNHFIKYSGQPLEIKGTSYNTDAYRNTDKMISYLVKHNIKISSQFTIEEVCKYLLDNNMLPGISFILSRRMIEKMGNRLNLNLHTDEKMVHTAAKEAETTMRRFENASEYTSLDDYKRLVKMFERGIAIHHSGMLPVFRELVEIMFEKGYVKMLLATETFAIGMNMPTKTVVFTNLSKFDGREFRYFYPHEYTQAAGRAGRRGKDTVGHVFHLNSLFEMPTEHEYQQIMCNRGDVMRSKFSIDLKTVLSMSNHSEISENTTTDITNRISKSMMGFEIQSEITELQKELDENIQQCDKVEISLKLLRTPKDDLDKYIEKKEIIKHCSAKQRKKVQREIVMLENTHKFITNDYSKMIEYHKLKRNNNNIKSEITNCEQYIYRNVRSVQEILQEYSLLDNDMNITELGKSISHVHEINPCVFSKMVPILNEMDVPGIMSVFSCFISDYKSKDDTEISSEISSEIPSEIKQEIYEIKKIYDTFEDIINRKKIFFARVSIFDASFVKYIYKWYQSDNTNECISVLHEYLSENNHFVGEFVKKMLKIVNITRESQKMCETNRNISLLSKIKQIEEKILKSIVTTQSLYF